MSLRDIIDQIVEMLQDPDVRRGFENRAREHPGESGAMGRAILKLADERARQRKEAN